MRVLVLNASPRKKGTVATLLRAVADAAGDKHDVEWVDVYGLNVQPCIACMKCRPEQDCVLPEDDGHVIARKIREADALVVGTPTHWGNMSAQLKVLLDRNVPVFMGEGPRGWPQPQQKGKRAIIVVACTAPAPFDFLGNHSRGALHAVRQVLRTGGYKIVGQVVQPGTKGLSAPSGRALWKAERLGRRL